jgi:hypothetical protein
VLLAASACNKKAPEPAPEPVPADEAKATPPDVPASSPHAPPGALPHAPASGEDLGLSWTDPEGWTRGPDRPMRKATYAVPKADGDTQDGELAVFYFGAGQGGDVEANIKRWTAQFGDVDEASIQRSERTVSDLGQHIVEIPDGTYTNTMAMHGPKGPQPNFALLGAVIDAPTGKYFFKMTGPANTVKKAKDAFYKMLDSIKPTK